MRRPGAGGHRVGYTLAHGADALSTKLGVTTPVIVKSAAEFHAIVAGNPLQVPDGDHSRLLVAFGADAAALRTLAPVAALARAPERMVVTDQAAYLHCPAGLLDSAAGAAMLGKAGRAVTTRNWATVLKLQASLGAG